MTKAEIMNCAAILAAGVMANRHNQLVCDADYAVDMMMDIAEKLQSKLGSKEEIEYPQI